MSEGKSKCLWEWQRVYLPGVLSEEADTVAAGASFPFVRASPVWWAKIGWIRSRAVVVFRSKRRLIFASPKSRVGCDSFNMYLMYQYRESIKNALFNFDLDQWGLLLL
jgi:hypothetical protein